MKLKQYCILVLMTLICNNLLADWKLDIKRFIHKNYDLSKPIDINNIRQEKVKLDKLSEKIPTWQRLIQYLEKPKFKNNLKTEQYLLKHMKGADGIVRPWVLYIPKSYYLLYKTPLLVALHGGVSRKNIIEDPIKYAKESNWIKLAKKNSWLAIFPMGQSEATWWDEVGMEHIRQQVRAVKANFNIDNDRIYMAGFSDGASAGFLHAMTRSNDYASIVALNGHIGVGSLDGKLSTYASNLVNIPIYTVTTDKDGLYPTSKMSPSIEMAQNTGAEVLYRKLRGHHSFDYDKEELPIIKEFLDRHPRNPLSTKLRWETADLEFSRCKWFSIDRIAGFEAAADWHKDFNCVMIDDRVSVGFFPEKSDIGVKVGKVLEGSFASSIGIKPDDVIVHAGNLVVKNNDDLDKAKASVKRGDLFPIKVLRAGKKISLEGSLPKENFYNVFHREAPSAVAKVKYSGNTVTVEGSRLAEFSVYVHPNMFKLDEKIRIICNGKVVFDDMAKPDKRFILNNYLSNLDTSLLYLCKISIKL